MTTVFCDSSGLYALAAPGDVFHERAASAWPELVEHHRLVTTNYVMLETLTLTQSRAGLKATSAVIERITGIVEVGWIDESLHGLALQELFATNQRQLSIVDCTSFAFMRRHRIETAFAYDPHFTRNGFRLFE